MTKKPLTRTQTVALAAIKNMRILSAAVGGTSELCRLVGMSTATFYRRLQAPMTLTLMELTALSRVAESEGLPFDLKEVSL